MNGQKASPAELLTVPSDRLLDAALDWVVGAVTQQALGLGDVGVRDRHVARLQRQLLDPRLFAERGGDQADELLELNGARVAKVDDLERAAFGRRRLELER